MSAHIQLRHGAPTDCGELVRKLLCTRMGPLANRDAPPLALPRTCSRSWFAERPEARLDVRITVVVSGVGGGRPESIRLDGMHDDLSTVARRDNRHKRNYLSGAC